MPQKDINIDKQVERDNHKKESIVQLRFGHNTPISSALHLAAVRYANVIEEKSGGKIKITVFPNQELGNDHQMVEMARTGDLDILLTPTAKMSVAIPSMQYADLPFYFPIPDDVYMMLDGEPGDLLLENLNEIGLVGVTFWENGFKQFTANTPLQKPEDFKNLKIRVMKSRIIMEQYKSLGAIPILIDFHETRKALSDNVVDGQENPLIAIVSMGFHEVQSHMTLSNHSYLGYVLSISKKSYEKLPTQLRAILIDTGKEITNWERKATHEKEKKLLEIIENAGVNIHTIDKKEYEEFAKLTAHIPSMFEEIIGSDIISKTEEIMLEKYGPDPKSNEQIVIGIDSDLSMDTKVSGLAIKRGAQLAVEEINANGGVLGKQLVLIAKDNRGLASRGVSNINAFIARPDVMAVIGGKHSSIIMAEMKSIQENGMPLLGAWSSASQVIDNGYNPNYIFRASANDAYASAYIIDWVIKRHQRPAILYENSIWGKGNLEKMQRHLKAKGMDFVFAKSFNRGKEYFTKEIRDLQALNADVLVIIAKPQEGGILVQEISQNESKIPIVSHWGIIGGNFFKENKMALNKVELSFFQTFSFINNENPVAKKVAQNYIKRYSKDSIGDIKAPCGVAQSYDLVHLLAKAIEKAGTMERSSIRNTLEHLEEYHGIVKHYERPFTPQNHDALDDKSYIMAKFASDGTIVPINE